MNRTVSAECEKSDCLAKTVNIGHGDPLYGEDPAAVSCIEVLKGAPLQLHDGNYNEESFCVLSLN